MDPTFKQTRQFEAKMLPCHMIGDEQSFFMYIKLFELGVEVAFYNESAVTYCKVDLLEFPRWSS